MLTIGICLVVGQIAAGALISYAILKSLRSWEELTHWQLFLYRCELRLKHDEAELEYPEFIDEDAWMEEDEEGAVLRLVPSSDLREKE